MTTTPGGPEQQPPAVPLDLDDLTAELADQLMAPDSDTAPPVTGDLVTAFCTTCTQPIVGTWLDAADSHPLSAQSHGHGGAWWGWVAVYTAADGSHRLPEPGQELHLHPDCAHLRCTDDKVATYARSTLVLARRSRKGKAQLRLWADAVDAVQHEIDATRTRLGAITAVDVMDAVDRVAADWAARARAHGHPESVAQELAALVRQAVAQAFQRGAALREGRD